MIPFYCFSFRQGLPQVMSKREFLFGGPKLIVPLMLLAARTQNPFIIELTIKIQICLGNFYFELARSVYPKIVSGPPPLTRGHAA